MNKRCRYCGRFLTKMWRRYGGEPYGDINSYWCSNLNCEMNECLVTNP